MRQGCMAMAAALVMVAVVAMGGSSAAAATGARQTGSFTYTSTTPQAATGTVASFQFQNPDNPSEKPYAVASMAVHAPPGTIVDTNVRPQCQASDAQLLAEGSTACPAETKVGGGTAVSDTGGGGPSPRYSQATVSDFNGQNEIIGFAQANDVAFIRSVDHTTFQGDTSTTVFPVFPGLPPPEPYTPLQSLQIYFPPFEHDGRAYIRTAPTCPPIGYWTITTDFTYHDGVTQSIESHSPCD